MRCTGTQRTRVLRALRVRARWLVSRFYRATAVCIARRLAVRLSLEVLFWGPPAALSRIGGPRIAQPLTLTLTLARTKLCIVWGPQGAHPLIGFLILTPTRLIGPRIMGPQTLTLTLAMVKLCVVWGLPPIHQWRIGPRIGELLTLTLAPCVCLVWGLTPLH